MREHPRRDSSRPLYVVAEKMLARGERLPAGWAIHGTTGYEFLNLVERALRGRRRPRGR